LERRFVNKEMICMAYMRKGVMEGSRKRKSEARNGKESTLAEGLEELESRI